MTGLPYLNYNLFIGTLDRQHGLPLSAPEAEAFRPSKR
jgi:hypothetical protein